MHEWEASCARDGEMLSQLRVRMLFYCDARRVRILVCTYRRCFPEWSLAHVCSGPRGSRDCETAEGGLDQSKGRFVRSGRVQAWREDENKAGARPNFKMVARRWCQNVQKTAEKELLYHIGDYPALKSGTTKSTSATASHLHD